MSFSTNASQQNSSQTSSYTPNATLVSALDSNLANAQALTGTPFQPYSGQMVAGFTPYQTQAQSGLAGIYNNQTGSAPLNAGISAAQGVAGYTPQTIQAPQLSSTDLSSYMNPYQSDVVNTTMQQLQRQQQISDAGVQAQATAAGAFGGSRSAVLQNLNDASYNLNDASTLANLNQSNYSQAQSAAQSDLNRQLTAAQSNQSAGLQGQSLNLGASNALANMGNMQLSQALQQAGAIGSAGNAQQQNQQQALNDAYQQWQSAQQYPITMQNLMNQTLGTFPSNYGTTSSSGSSSATSSNAGLNWSSLFAPIKLP